jgi:phosphatidylglycerophosphate synthase
MFKILQNARIPVRFLAIAVSALLFAYLVWRAGPNRLWEDFRNLGWGFITILALAGISHLAKTWAWRLTLGEDKDKISFPRLVALRLGAEAGGQLGILGQTFGDSLRISRLGTEIPVVNGLASVTLDRGLYLVTGSMVTIAGISAALPVLSRSHALGVYAVLFVVLLMLFLVFTLLAVRKRWPVLSAGARLIGRFPAFRNWAKNEYLLIQSVENTLLDFHHKTPRAFWASFSLNLAAQCLAVGEVCLVLWLLGVKIGFSGALVIEALTKLLNLIGNFNPGNIGTYEGGNMLIGKMFGLNSATGLALGLSRRLRSLFWAAAGVACLVWLTRPRKSLDSDSRGDTPASIPKERKTLAGAQKSPPPEGSFGVAIFLSSAETNGNQFTSSLARVGTLPVLLRTILGVQKLGPAWIAVVADPVTRRRVQRKLFLTGRLPEVVQWIDADANTPLFERLHLIATQARTERFLLINGNTTYHPLLLRNATEWTDEGMALALMSGDKPVGIHVVSLELTLNLTRHGLSQIDTLEGMHARLRAMRSVACVPVGKNLWQSVQTPEDRRTAERKLDRWLVKPTDGMYAQMNRRISIPISRQLIRFPITANMVSLFTLGVGFASAAFFAVGGYWNTLLGAFLCLFASILDGCDGEVARLKLQESDFGCWLETVCDYLFYLFLFVGMTLGLWRSSGAKMYLVWGGLLFFGSIASFLAIGWERHRLAAGRPEQLLRIWQSHAESRPSNPFLYFSRHTEFIVRRCFFPYALLFFALFNIMNVAFVLSAIGANLVWPIALYSSRTFAGALRSTVPSPAASAEMV